MNREGVVSFFYPFKQVRLVTAFAFAVLFSTPSYAIFCGNFVTQTDVTLTGNLAFDMNTQLPLAVCAAAEEGVFVEAETWEFVVYPALLAGREYPDLVGPEGGIDIDILFAALDSHFDQAPTFPELSQIATSFGAGFVIGLPLFAVVFGARQIIRLMR